MLPLIGAAGFGCLLGWYLYYINRYRTESIKLTDLVTLVGAIGGGAILAIFPAGSSLFGAYGIGLFLGFYGYFAILLLLVWRSKKYNFDWFLDSKPGGRPMEDSSINR